MVNRQTRVETGYLTWRISLWAADYQRKIPKMVVIPVTMAQKASCQTLMSTYHSYDYRNFQISGNFALPNSGTQSYYT